MSNACILILTVVALSGAHALGNGRHVCLFRDYGAVRGPHFNGLFDELFERTNFEQKRVAWLTTTQGDPTTMFSLLTQDLGLDDIEGFQIDKLNPLELERELSRFEPSILWSAHAESVPQLRYSMRTSGLDGIVERYVCGSGHLFVGEGASALCTGSQIRARDQAPAKEPQYFGLELIGPDLTFSFEEDEGSSSNIRVLKAGQVYVWSQTEEAAMEFIMNPKEKGSIQGLRYLPPISQPKTPVEGQVCTGEPAIDPSRMLQMRGDSEWFECDD
jgi:aromatic ring-cleaving dioxygenase